MSHHHDVREEHFRDVDSERRTKDEIQAFTEFMRRTPPPDNFMARQDSSSSSSGDDKWKLNIFRKRRKPRRQRRKRPPVIRLPDSAVAASTIGGYRHIAISIPLEYSHLGPVSRSQYPVYDAFAPECHRAVESRLQNSAPDRAATKLKPVVEGRESHSSLSLSPEASPRGEGSTFLTAPPRKPIAISTIPLPQKRPPTRRGKEPEKRRGSAKSTTRQPAQNLAGTSQVGSVLRPLALRESEQRAGVQTRGAGPETILQTIEIPTGHAARRHKTRERLHGTEQAAASSDVYPKGHSRKTSGDSNTSSPLSAKSPIQLALPSRKSSLKAKASAKPGDTIDNVIGSRRTSTSDDRANDNGNGNDKGPGVGLGLGLGLGFGKGHDDGHDTRPRGSVAESLATTESSPKLFKAQTATAYQTIPIVVRPPSRGRQGDFPGQYSPGIESSDSPLNLDFPQPPILKVSRAVQTDPFPVAEPRVGRVLSRKERVRERKQRDLEMLRAELKKEDEAPTGRLTKGSVLPGLGESGHQGTPSTSRPASTAQTREFTPTSVMPGMQHKFPQLSPGTILGRQKRQTFGPASNSRMLSPSRSSPVSWDQAASLPQEVRGSVMEEREIQMSPHVENTPEEQGQTTERPSRQELIARYEDLKEARIHDMEKRMRRLERNGEVWLRSLGPLMDNLNRLLQEQHTWQRGSRLAYPSSTFGPRQRRPRRHRSIELSSDSFQSLDSPPEPSRSETIRGEESQSSRHQPPHFHLTPRRDNIRGSQSVTITQPLSSPLQEEFETELEIRHLNEEANDEVDVGMQRAARSRRRGGAAETAASITTEGDAGYSSSLTSSSIHSGFDTIQPLMRELQAAAQTGVRPQVGTTGTRAGVEGEDPIEASPEGSIDEDDAFALF